MSDQNPVGKHRTYSLALTKIEEAEHSMPRTTNSLRLNQYDNETVGLPRHKHGLTE